MFDKARLEKSSSFKYDFWKSNKNCLNSVPVSHSLSSRLYHPVPLRLKVCDGIKGMDHEKTVPHELVMDGYIYISVEDETLFWCLGYFDICCFVLFLFLSLSLLLIFTKVYDLGLFSSSF